MDVTRFRNTLPAEGWSGVKVMLVGVGGIGSYTATALVRMGVEDLAFVDYDTVERENVATQCLAHNAIGLKKVHAVADEVERVSTEVDVRVWPERLTLGHLIEYTPHVLITSVDSIESRREIIECVGEYHEEDRIQLVVDPRMGFEELEVYTSVEGEAHEDTLRYIDTLKEREHRELPCGAKAIAYTGMFAGAVVASLVRRWRCGSTLPWCTYGDIGSYEFSTLWREGEKWNECEVE